MANNPHVFRRTAELARQIRDLSQQLDAERDQNARLRRKIDKIERLRRTNAKIVETLERESADSDFNVARTAAVRRLTKLARSHRPVIVGPWYGEIGFEAICWAPFVRWALVNHDFDLQRVAIVSRGGARDLYGFDVPYVDLFDMLPPLKLRKRKSTQHKQDVVRQLDRQLIRDATRRLGMRRPHLLHPSLMYAALAPFWRGLIAPEQVLTMLTPHRVTPPRIPGLPAKYHAVRFYSSRAFPDAPRNRLLAAALVDCLAAESHVVVLRSDRRFDDHGDLPVGPAPNVTVIDIGNDPASNVSVQVSVMAHAQSFVGTYGGGSYLAALTGVPVLALWSEATWRLHHLGLAQALFRQTNGGRFSVVSCDDLAVVLACAPPAACSVAQEQ